MRRDDLVIGPREKAIEAVKAGRKEDAVRYIEELYEEFRPLHDRYSEWIHCLLCFIVERLGEEALEQALSKSFEDVYKGRWVANKNLGPEEIVKTRCKSHRSHYSNFYVEEDEEKFVIVIPYCGSGGRIHNEGLPGKTGKAYPWSFNQEGVSYYCCHEPVFEARGRELGLEQVHYDYRPQFDEAGRPKGHLCRWTIYKKPKQEK